MAASTEPAIRLLDDFQLKALLQDVESLNVSRDAIILKDICKKDKRLYGEKATNLRRRFQKHWAIIKKYPIAKYVLLLDDNAITPSATTSALLRQATEPKGDTGNVATKTCNDEGDDDDDDDDEEDDDEEVDVEDDLANSFGNINLGTFSGDDESSMFGSARKMPKYKSPGPAKNRLTSPGLTPVASLAGTTVSTVSEEEKLAEFAAINGTRKNPWLVFVNTTNPERNREFDIERINGMKFGKVEYNGYHIRRDKNRQTVTSRRHLYIPVDFSTY